MKPQTSCKTSPLKVCYPILWECLLESALSNLVRLSLSKCAIKSCETIPLQVCYPILWKCLFQSAPSNLVRLSLYKCAIKSLQLCAPISPQLKCLLCQTYCTRIFPYLYLGKRGKCIYYFCASQYSIFMNSRIGFIQSSYFFLPSASNRFNAEGAIFWC